MPETQPAEVRTARDRSVIGGVPFEVTNLTEAVGDVVTLASTHPAPGVPVRLSNAYCVSLASTDVAYHSVLAGPGLAYPDGAPVAWFIRLKRKELRTQRRVRGPSLFTGTLDAGREAGLRHFMLGATDDVLTRLSDESSKRYPGVQIVGSYAPPFGPLDDKFFDEAVTRIRAADPHIVWIGLGTPKQDFAAAELATRIPGVFAGVGAAFDFVAGSVREAPRWVQNSGFEWLYRLAAEPKRLWRRYLFGNARFLRVAIRDL